MANRAARVAVAVTIDWVFMMCPPVDHSTRTVPFPPEAAVPTVARSGAAPAKQPGQLSRSARRIDSEPRLARAHDRLASVLDGDLVEDVRDVIAHGLFGQREMGGDLGVVATAGEE